MLSGEFFDCLDRGLTIVRGGESTLTGFQPQKSDGYTDVFGTVADASAAAVSAAGAPAFDGVQLILSGDLFQLPPVNKRILSAISPSKFCTLDPPLTSRFLNRGLIFQSSAFWRAGLSAIELTHVHRQADREMIGHLNAIRVGKRHNLPAALAYFNSRCCGELHGSDTGAPPVLPTQLCLTNAEVNHKNRTGLQSVHNAARVFRGHDYVEVDLEAVNDAEVEPNAAAGGSSWERTRDRYETDLRSHRAFRVFLAWLEFSVFLSGLMREMTNLESYESPSPCFSCLYCFS